jgi:cytochrome c
VKFNSSGSSDPDAGDVLRYDWTFAEGQSATGITVEHVFTEPGRYPVRLTVTDQHGASAETSLMVSVGNAAPDVRFRAPVAHEGRFFEWGKPIRYQIFATDEEDGELPAEQVLVQVERRERVRTNDEDSLFPGLGLMRAGTCFACHRAAEKNAGPAYLEVARRYAVDPSARDRLAAKIVSGGTGVWGDVPMPPHPQVTLAQAGQMLDWIFSLASRETTLLPRALEGEFTVPPPPSSFGSFANGVVVLTATATDRGTPEAPPLDATATVTLRTRRQHAAAFDYGHRVITQHNLEDGDGLVARLETDSWLAFEQIPLNSLRSFRLRLRPLAGEGARLEFFRGGDPAGSPFATLPLPAPVARGAKAIELEVPAPEGLRLLSFPSDLSLRLAAPGPSACELMWIEFR